MPEIESTSDSKLLDNALLAAQDTKRLIIGEKVLDAVPACFIECFGSVRPFLIVDPNTQKAAGREVHAAFLRAGLPCDEPFQLPIDVYAEIETVERLAAAMAEVEAVPVAIGSGTINDLTKLAAHRLDRRYMAVATAASMDGYTAFGASITATGSKQTFDCPAPYAVLADLDVISSAPTGMNASGYADLIAKNVAGADWILADAAGVESIDSKVWQTVHDRLKTWVGEPSGVAGGDRASLQGLVSGLMMSGFAMQAHKTSRPASGADHQFSHLWDMQHHTFQGEAPSHGFKVGIGALASVSLYQELLRLDLEHVDLDQVVSAWPTFDTVRLRILNLFDQAPLATKAIEETQAKHPSQTELRDQLTRIQADWPSLRERLAAHLISFSETRAMLHAAGCPTHPEEIGISLDRLRRSFDQASYIRRRFTVLDVVRRLGFFDSAMERLFSSSGPWKLRRID